MDNPKREFQSTRFPFTAIAFLTIAAIVAVSLERAEGSSSSPAVTYSHGELHLTIPYLAPIAGSGSLILEILDPEGQVLGRTERELSISAGAGRWQGEIKLVKSLPLEDLIWHRLHYRFEYDGKGEAALEGIQSISQSSW